MNVNDFFLRLKRYLYFSIQYFFMEKPRGLDFTMRDKSLMSKSKGLYHGYSKTNEKHLHEIFKTISCKNKRLLDIGCGKGVVLKEATKFPFEKIAGIEIQKDLVEIARKNFKIMGLEHKIECIIANAIEFDKYSDYNVFFLFNPFSVEILSKVLDKIIESRTTENHIVTIIYHNPTALYIFDEYPLIKKEILHDKLKNYDTCILTLDLKRK